MAVGAAIAPWSRLRRLVARKLRLRWSPEQIAGWLCHTFPAEASLQLSLETIYRSLYVQARGVLRREVLRSLRTHRTMRRSRRASRQEQGRGQIVEAVPISWSARRALRSWSRWTARTPRPWSGC
jgi:IS30 family transposase